MLVVPQKKAIVLRARDKSTLTSVFAKHQDLGKHERGGDKIALPLHSETMRVLKNMGVNVEGRTAIEHLYDWPKIMGIYAPMPHQIATAAWMTVNPRGYILSDQRTGKTNSVIWATDFLMREGVIKGKVLIVCTVSTMQLVWQDGIDEVAIGRTSGILTGTRKQRQKMLGKDHDYYIINHDGIKTITNELRLAVESGEIDAIVVDEGAAFGDHTAQRTKAMKWIARGVPNLWWLTATATSRGPDKAFAQVNIVTPGRMPEQFLTWKYRVMDKINKYKWIRRKDSQQKVFEMMQPAIRFAKADVLKDMPPLTHQVLDIPFSAEQQKFVNSLRKQKAFLTEDGDTISAVNPGVAVMKLLQLSGGACLTDDRKVARFNAKPRLEAMLGLIENATAKSIVFCSFKHHVDLVVEYLTKQGIECDWVDSRKTGKKRNDTFYKFMKGKTNTLVCHPQTVAHGLEFSVADVSIYFTPHRDAEDVAQANQRMASAAQKNPMGIYYLSSSYLERQAYSVVRNGLDWHSETMSLFDNFVEGVDE